MRTLKLPTPTVSLLAAFVLIASFAVCGRPGTKGSFRVKTSPRIPDMPRYDSFCESHQNASIPSPGSLSESFPETGSYFWSATKVQENLRTLLERTEMRCTPSAGYAASYLRMTARRDVERCRPGGALVAHDPLDARLKDALSDLMTRQFVAVTTACLEGRRPSTDVGGRWCALYGKAQRENWDAVTLALGGTAIYLTTHLAHALSALPFVDPLWVDTPYASFESRLKRLESFRPSYERFDGFLGDSLDVVAEALDESGLLTRRTLPRAARLGEHLALGAHIFRHVRSHSFELGVELARHIPHGTHPLTQRLLLPSGYAVDILRLDESVTFSLPTAENPSLVRTVEKLLEHSERVEARFTPIVLPLLFGALTYDDKRHVTSAYRKCEQRFSPFLFRSSRN